MLVSIKDIKVKNRVRKDLGDLQDLMDSLRRYGLLNPITLNSKYQRIAGERRLEAAKAIGWTSINANIIDNLTPLSQLEMELEENNQRKEFTDEELLDGYHRLERLRNPTLLMKLWKLIMKLIDAIAAFFRKMFGTKKGSLTDTISQ